MPGRLKNRLKQNKPFESTAQEAMLSLFVAAAHLRGQIERVCNEFGIGLNHYNVLRILAGAPPEGYPRCEIIDRLLDRGPDVTRLTDRLVRRGLLQRERSAEDRRVMLHRITPKGKALLSKIRPEVDRVTGTFAEQVDSNDQQHLIRICERIYGEVHEEVC